MPYSQLNQENYSKEADRHDLLQLDSTLYLAYRDIPLLLEENFLNYGKEKGEIFYLDFGCGTGFSTKQISGLLSRYHSNVSVFGLDCNNENLSIAKSALPNALFLKLDQNADLPANLIGKFDVITCNFVLLEQNDADMRKTLAKIHAALSKNGIVIVTNTRRKTYQLDKNWYTLNTKFDENKPSIKLDGKEKLTDDQCVKLEVTDPNGNGLFSFYDFFHSGNQYRNAYQASGFSLEKTIKPIGKKEDGMPWKDEEKVSPYKIHVLKSS